MAGLSSTREENFTSKDIFSAETIICIADPKNISIIDSKNIWIADPMKKYLYFKKYLHG